METIITAVATLVLLYVAYEVARTACKVLCPLDDRREPTEEEWCGMATDAEIVERYESRDS